MKRLQNFFSKNARLIMGAGYMALTVTLLTTVATMGPLPSKTTDQVQAQDLRGQLIQIAERDSTVIGVLDLAGDDRASQTAHLACMIEEYGEKSEGSNTVSEFDKDSLASCAADKLASMPDEMNDADVQSANRCLAGMLAKAEWRSDNITKPATELRACGLDWLVDFMEIEDEQPKAAAQQGMM
ncbi:MAG: hypothetical protein Alpg2KO_29920 [Alphaproteobacteria bacterium]